MTINTLKSNYYMKYTFIEYRVVKMRANYFIFIIIFMVKCESCDVMDLNYISIPIAEMFCIHVKQ